jgi:hypothetical protein
MEHVRTQQRRDSLKPTSLTVALMAEHLIGQGWPATRPALAPEGSQQHPDAVPPCGESTGFVKPGHPEYLCQRGQGHEPPHEVMLNGGVRMAWGAEEDGQS